MLGVFKNHCYNTTLYKQDYPHFLQPAGFHETCTTLSFKNVDRRRNIQWHMNDKYLPCVKQLKFRLHVWYGQTHLWAVSSVLVYISWLGASFSSQQGLTRRLKNYHHSLLLMSTLTPCLLTGRLILLTQCTNSWLITPLWWPCGFRKKKLKSQN